jgi:hypothetical protein
VKVRAAVVISIQRSTYSVLGVHTKDAASRGYMADEPEGLKCVSRAIEALFGGWTSPSTEPSPHAGGCLII